MYRFLDLLSSVPLQFSCSCYMEIAASVQEQFLLFHFRGLSYGEQRTLPPYDNRILIISVNSLGATRMGVVVNFDTKCRSRISFLTEWPWVHLSSHFFASFLSCCRSNCELHYPTRLLYTVVEIVNYCPFRVRVNMWNVRYFVVQMCQIFFLSLFSPIWRKQKEYGGRTFLVCSTLNHKIMFMGKNNNVSVTQPFDDGLIKKINEIKYFVGITLHFIILCDCVR